MNHSPHYRDQIQIETWPHGRYRLFSIRDFLFSDDQGFVFCRARTAWLLVDANAKKIVPLERLPRPVPYQSDRSSIETLPEKLPQIEGAEEVLHKQIAYTDLDLNQHVNNARYVEFILDSYPQEFHASHRVRSLTISFQNESKFGNHLVIIRQGSLDQPGRHQLAARLAGEEKIVFRAIVDWAQDG